MGYTHYWYETDKPGKIPAKALSIIKDVVDEAYKANLIQLEWDTPGAPVVTETEIRFNGIGEDGHETFYYEADKGERLDYEPDKRYFDFCKTAQKPYDVVVMKVLLVLARYIPTFDLKSDGAFLDEWKETLDWFNHLSLGFAYVSETLAFQ